MRRNLQSVVETRRKRDESFAHGCPNFRDVSSPFSSEDDAKYFLSSLESSPPTIVHHVPTGSVQPGSDGRLVVYPGSIVHLDCLFLRTRGNPVWIWSATSRRYPTGELSTYHRVLAEFHAANGPPPQSYPADKRLRRWVEGYPAGYKLSPPDRGLAYRIKAGPDG